MALETVTVEMRRTNHDQSWGFRLQGGQEYHQPLTISRVIEGSLADRAGLKDGDRVKKIGHQNVEHSSHNEAQKAIENSGNVLDVYVERNVSTIFTPEFPKIPAGAEQKTVHIGPSGEQESSYSFKKSSKYQCSTTGPGYTTATTTSIVQPSPKPFQPSSLAAAPVVSRAPLTSQLPPPSAVSARPSSPIGGYSNNSSYSKKTTTSVYESGSKFLSPSAAPEPPPVPAVPPPQSKMTKGHFSPVVSVPARSVSPGIGAGRPRSPAMDYLNRTGGLFGIDPHVNAPQKEEPSYLRSATLKLIQEEQKSSTGQSPVPQSPQMPTKHVEPPKPNLEQPVDGSAPICANCEQRIIGVFCKAGGKTLHGQCFNCSTCGTSLKNIGYFLVNDKLYCDLHAKQQKGNQFKATAPIDPNLFASYGSPNIRPTRTPEPVKAAYQPEVMKPGGLLSESYTKSSYSTISNSNVRPLSPKPANFSPSGAFSTSVSQKISQFSTPAGDAVELFGPKTPSRAKGILKQLQEGPRIPFCESCRREIRGPFVLALGKSWCPDHFLCSTPSCHRPLLDIGFIEHNNGIHCEFCYEKLYAPSCSKCQKTILADCLTALNKRWHPECFTCAQCHKPFGNASFFLENNQPYCEADWNNLFTTKCNCCHFPIEAGDRWVEALGNSFHSDCFCCTICQKTLEGQSFYAKGGRPYCKAHA